MLLKMPSCTSRQHPKRFENQTNTRPRKWVNSRIERQLAHDEPNAVRRTYNHAGYLKDRATMMQRWADLLDEWKKKTADAMKPVLG